MHTLRYSTISPLISPPHIMRIIMVQEACTKNGMTIVFWAGVRLLLSLTTLMTDDVIRDTFLISLDTYSTSYLVLHAVHSGGSGSSAVPEVKKVSQGRTEQGGNQYSNTAESGSCLNRRTHCRPGNFPPLLHHTHIMCRAARSTSRRKHIRPAPCHGLPSKIHFRTHPQKAHHRRPPHHNLEAGTSVT